MTISNDNKIVFARFFSRIAGWDKFSDGYIEVVTDYTTSKYFNHEQVEQLIEYSLQMAESGHEVHFGPAVRENDLGSKRSDASNILWCKACWVDIDAPDKTVSKEQQIQATKMLMKELKIKLKEYNLEPSFVVSSGHGYHVYFCLRKCFLGPTDNWTRMQNAVINLANGDRQAKDPTRLMRGPGTYNYKDRDNPKEVKLLYDSGKLHVEDNFKEIIKDHGSNTVTTNTTDTVTSEVKPLGFIPPCIAHLLDPNVKPPLGYRHQVRMILGTFGFHEGWKVDDTVQKTLHTTDDLKKAESDIRGVYSTLESDPARYSVGCKPGSSLRALVDANVTVCDESNCEFKKKKEGAEEEKKDKFSAWFDGLVDLVLDDSNKVAFLVKEDGQLIIKDKHETLEGVLVPPPRESIIWALPKGSEVIKHYTNDTDSQLFEELVEYHRGISELPSDSHYQYLAAWDMHTYLVQLFEYSPMTWFFAIPERGKSRTGKGCIYVAFRGIHLNNINEAHIIRLATNLKATLFFDMMDLWKKVERVGYEDLILCRFEKGVKMPKVLYPEKGAFVDTVYYDIYGATIIATNEPVNHILETRTVQVIMPEASRDFEDDIKPEHGLPFRERLVAFRARWMDQQIPDADKPVKGRLGDMLRPIRRVVNLVCADETWFLEFASNVENMRKKSASDTLEAQVVSAIIQAEHCVKNGHLLHADYRGILNKDRPDRYQISPQKVGRVTASLGFQKYYSGDAKGIYWNQELLDSLCDRYGIKIEQEILTL